MVYKNLAAEMARKGITKKDLARSLNMRYPTIVDKTNGKSRFYLDEAIKIKDMFFPDLDLEYLFESDLTEKGA
ncbi:XRE family transcriptional regulator [Parageobacillus phage vB_PtoS_NIIg3.2]|nr:XRE family transcriptional regulator [Parageobacillus phage vB_PtoS_NIIg3.2]